jgi:plastocyanin
MRHHLKALAAFVVIGLFALQPGRALGAEHSIKQEDKTFSPSTLTIEAGDTVYFFNNDTIPHNVFSTSPGNEFDLGNQKPDIATPVTFTTPGEIEVGCHMHPHMKATITVVE